MVGLCRTPLTRDARGMCQDGAARRPRSDTQANRRLLLAAATRQLAPRRAVEHAAHRVRGRREPVDASTATSRPASRSKATPRGRRSGRWAEGPEGRLGTRPPGPGGPQRPGHGACGPRSRAPARQPWRPTARRGRARARRLSAPCHRASPRGGRGRSAAAGPLAEARLGALGSPLPRHRGKGARPLPPRRASALRPDDRAARPGNGRARRGGPPALAQPASPGDAALRERVQRGHAPVRAASPAPLRGCVSGVVHGTSPGRGRTHRGAPAESARPPPR